MYELVIRGVFRSKRGALVGVGVFLSTLTSV